MGIWSAREMERLSIIDGVSDGLNVGELDARLEWDCTAGGFGADSIDDFVNVCIWLNSCTTQ